MEKHDHPIPEPATSPGFWRSRTGLALIVFLVIAAVLLGYEHRVHIFGGPSSSVVFLLAWIGLHFFMHRGHGGHGGHGGGGGSGGHGGHRRPTDPEDGAGSDPARKDGGTP